MKNSSIEKKILAVNPTPPMRTFNNLGFSIGVIDEAIEDYSPWLLEHFVGLHYRKSWDSIAFDMPYSYRWDCFTSKMNFVIPFSQAHFLNTVRSNLRNGYYIYLTVNENYIPERFAYQKANIIHDLYVFGFDNGAHMFHTLAYNDKQRFEVQQISYETMYRAFARKPVNFCFIPFQLKKEYPFTKRNDKVLDKQITNYLYPKSRRRGIHIYSYLYAHLNSSETLKMGNFRVLMEHMYVLTNLKNYGIDYDENYKNAKILFTLALKYNLTKNTLMVDQLKRLLTVMEKGEQRACAAYLEKRRCCAKTEETGE